MSTARSYPAHPIYDDEWVLDSTDDDVVPADSDSRESCQPSPAPLVRAFTRWSTAKPAVGRAFSQWAARTGPVARAFGKWVGVARVALAFMTWRRAAWATARRHATAQAFRHWRLLAMEARAAVYRQYRDDWHRAATTHRHMWHMFEMEQRAEHEANSSHARWMRDIHRRAEADQTCHNLARQSEARVEERTVREENSQHGHGMRDLHRRVEAETVCIQLDELAEQRRRRAAGLSDAETEQEIASRMWIPRLERAELACEAEAEASWTATKQHRAAGARADAARADAELTRYVARDRSVEDMAVAKARADMAGPVMAHAQALDGMQAEKEYQERFADILQYKRLDKELSAMNAVAMEHRAQAAEAEARLQRHNLDSLARMTSAAVQEDDDIRVLNLRVEQARLQAVLSRYERDTMENRVEIAILRERQSHVLGETPV